jgi:hypothetical protein
MFISTSDRSTVHNPTDDGLFYRRHILHRRYIHHDPGHHNNNGGPP